MRGLAAMVKSLELAVTARLWISFDAPELIPVRAMVCSPASGFRVRLAIGSSVGGSLTGATLSRKDWLAIAPLVSVTVRVIVAVPNAFVAGKICKVRLLPLPPNTMFEVETSVGLDEEAERSKLSTEVSA